MLSDSFEQSYYLALEVEGNNVSRTDHALVPNCGGVCVLPRPFETHMRQGREDYYIQYLVEGDMRVWLDGERRMRPGQAVLYYPRTAYRYAQLGEGRVRYYWLHFTGYAAGDLIGSCRLPNARLLTVGHSASLLLAVCVELSRCIGREAAPQGAGTGRVYRALAYIHRHYDEKLTVPLLAGLEHVSPSRFRLLFREATGLSPLEYVTCLRLNHARQLLQQTDDPLAEVARAVGYSDQFYFSRVFKERTGLTPSAYRRG